MVRMVRSLLLLLGLALLPACAASERMAEAQGHAPAVAPLPPRPAAMSARVARSVVVHFDSSSADIRAAAMQILYGAAVDLRGARLTAIRITGFADGAGRRSYNQKLSERRAAAVADQLGKLGLRADSIEVKGAGETKGKPRRSHADRRVEITFEVVEETAVLSLLQPAPSLNTAAAGFPPATVTITALALPPQGDLAGHAAPAPLHGGAKPAIKLLPARDGTTWLPPPAG